MPCPTFRAVHKLYSILNARSNDKGSVALEYIVISIFATGIALASMTYIQSIVNDKLEAFEAEIQESEMSIIGD